MSNLPTILHLLQSIDSSLAKLVELAENPRKRVYKSQAPAVAATPLRDRMLAVVRLGIPVSIKYASDRLRVEYETANVCLLELSNSGLINPSISKRGIKVYTMTAKGIALASALSQTQR